MSNQQQLQQQQENLVSKAEAHDAMVDLSIRLRKAERSLEMMNQLQQSMCSQMGMSGNVDVNAINARIKELVKAEKELKAQKEATKEPEE